MLTEFLNDIKYFKGTITANPGQFEWVPGDTKALFDTNLKTNRASLKNNGWIDADPIIYNVNTHLFRGTWDIGSIKPNGIIAIGCSFTTGLGIHEQDTWPARLQDKIDLPVYNLGTPGNGLETNYRVLTYWIQQMKPKYVCLLSIGPYRREFFNYSTKQWESFGLWDSTAIVQQYINPTESIIAAHRTIYAIAGLCNAYGAKLMVKSISDNFQTVDEIKHGHCARDLIHPGPSYMNGVARAFHKDIQQNTFFKYYDVLQDATTSG